MIIAAMTKKDHSRPMEDSRLSNCPSSSVIALMSSSASSQSHFPTRSSVLIAWLSHMGRNVRLRSRAYNQSWISSGKVSQSHAAVTLAMIASTSASGIVSSASMSTIVSMILYAQDRDDMITSNSMVPVMPTEARESLGLSILSP
eukprot:CAMPEP_0180820036 /NCGR_PEP_ID=MMETSP1038_2-20121128/70065_1 /TAXON_ID=632150 /ORGANISM="Azadinium spinosum, Strain 3D9" /LENGTH=144 /DNA_ID=CAMNT_0022862089 /DNA_START=23 /DNA_END=458 /DNA_ORIENTATION=+